MNSNIKNVLKPAKDNLMQTRFKVFVTAATLLLCGAAQAEGTDRPQFSVRMNMVDEKGIGESVGQIFLHDTQYGLVFTPSLTGLPQGIHGFHVHENPSCEPMEQAGKMVAALAAGGHYDPLGSKHHDFPWGHGHLGDLPALFVDAAGNATNPVLAPRLKLADVRGRSLMIHAGGDNHSDHPAPLGGGGARVVCGVIQ